MNHRDYCYFCISKASIGRIDINEHIPIQIEQGDLYRILKKYRLCIIQQIAYTSER